MRSTFVWQARTRRRISNSGGMDLTARMSSLFTHGRRIHSGLKQLTSVGTRQRPQVWNSKRPRPCEAVLDLLFPFVLMAHGLSAPISAALEGRGARQESYVVTDGLGQRLAYVYFEDKSIRQGILKRPSKDDAWQLLGRQFGLFLLYCAVIEPPRRPHYRLSKAAPLVGRFRRI